MMTRAPRSLASATLILWLASGTLTALIALGVISVQKGANAELSQDFDRLSRFKSIDAFEPKLAHIERAQSNRQFDGLFMAGGTPAEMAARLQARVNGIATDKGIAVLRSSDIAETDRDGLTLIGADVDLLGTANSIYKMLGEIELATPLMVIERLALRAPMAGQREIHDEQPISVSIRVYAAFRRPSAANSVQ